MQYELAYVSEDQVLIVAQDEETGAWTVKRECSNEREATVALHAHRLDDAIARFVRQAEAARESAGGYTDASIDALAELMGFIARQMAEIKRSRRCTPRGVSPDGIAGDGPL